jgi:phosphohistidine phosphatase
MPSFLHIIRHGKAEQDSPTGLDRDRALKPRGERQARWLGEQLAASMCPPALIIASPFTRARQTAELIQRSLGCPLVFDERLEVGNSVSDAADVIASHTTTNPERERAGRTAAASPALALVGHNPQLELLIGALIHGPLGGRYELRTGECFTFEFNDLARALGHCIAINRLRIDDE